MSPAPPRARPSCFPLYDSEFLMPGYSPLVSGMSLPFCSISGRSDGFWVSSTVGWVPVFSAAMTFGRYSSELAMYCPFACRPGWALSNAVSRASICAGVHPDVQYVKVVEFGDDFDGDFDGDEPHAAASSVTREPATTALARGVLVMKITVTPSGRDVKFSYRNSQQLSDFTPCLYRPLSADGDLDLRGSGRVQPAHHPQQLGRRQSHTSGRRRGMVHVQEHSAASHGRARGVVGDHHAVLVVPAVHGPRARTP